MDLSGIPTPHMDWESNNLVASWKKFKQHCELIFAGPLKQKSEEVKVTYLLLWIGDTGRDIFNTWAIPGDEAKRQARTTKTQSSVCSLQIQQRSPRKQHGGSVHHETEIVIH